MNSLFFTVMATSSPEEEMVANLPRTYQSMGKLQTPVRSTTFE